LIQTTTDIPYGINKTIAKECALIAVDEILEWSSQWSGLHNEISYWQDVKTEIEKL
jgi:hypothetical protein